ncbi:3D domain-containing protein [Paenibacillus sp. NPDC058174]|uniref:3D domain-containing protein n=1 Tax=Paenibacillus sp. NPDC058174 TaxID=3346366 RepID=UPI0036DAD84E
MNERFKDLEIHKRVKCVNNLYLAGKLCMSIAMLVLAGGLSIKSFDNRIEFSQYTESLIPISLKTSVADDNTSLKELIVPDKRVFSDDVKHDKYDIYEITAYTSGKESTGKTLSHPEYGITASGSKVKEGRTVACPRSIAFGTKVYIPSLNKVYVCEDRGGKIRNKHLDIYMDNLLEAKEFGRKKLKVIFLYD